MEAVKGELLSGVHYCRQCGKRINATQSAKDIWVVKLPTGSEMIHCSDVCAKKVLTVVDKLDQV